PHRATVRTALLDLEPGETSAPREAPEVPGAAVEIDLRAFGVARLAVPRNDAEVDGTWRSIVAAAQLDRGSVVVSRDVIDVRAFLHAEDLALVAGISLITVEDHHRQLALLQVLRQA